MRVSIFLNTNKSFLKLVSSLFSIYNCCIHNEHNYVSIFKLLLVNCKLKLVVLYANVYVYNFVSNV